MRSAPSRREAAAAVAPSLSGHALRVTVGGRELVRAIGAEISSASHCAAARDHAARPRRKTACGGPASGIHVALGTANRAAAGNITAACHAFRPRCDAASGRRAMGVDISSRSLDGRAAGHSAAGRGAARSDRGPLDSRRAVREVVPIGP